MDYHTGRFAPLADRGVLAPVRTGGLDALPPALRTDPRVLLVLRDGPPGCHDPVSCPVYPDDTHPRRKAPR